MNKTAGIVIGVVIVVLLGAGVWWLLMNKVTAPGTATTPDTTSTTDTSTTSNTSSDTTTPADTGEVQSGTVNVSMKNTAFSPASIKIKKGTKVVWTNQDSIMHNVVAEESNSNGLPTSNDLIGKGQTYSFTFNTVGTVKYHCTPHPFMTGTIEVVE